MTDGSSPNGWRSFKEGHLPFVTTSGAGGRVWCNIIKIIHGPLHAHSQE